mmetsp:Transcript_45306/g.151080  ORF Transcript_45306/g.151080 Transcript_45306/m.151080 type:complete len:283 (+) Transcript_45306:1231-2079(+)
MASALSCAEPEKMRSMATTSTLSTIVAELTASTSASLDEFRTRAGWIRMDCVLVASRPDGGETRLGAPGGGRPAAPLAPARAAGKKMDASVFAPVPIMCSRWNSERHLSTCAQAPPRWSPSVSASERMVLKASMLRPPIVLPESRYVYFASIVTKASRSVAIPNSAAMCTALAKPRMTSATSSTGTSSSYRSSMIVDHEASSAHQQASNIGRACSTLRDEWYTARLRALALKSSCDSLTMMADSRLKSFERDARAASLDAAAARRSCSIISLILISLVVMAW